jgi:hypothetical protein
MRYKAGIVTGLSVLLFNFVGIDKADTTGLYVNGVQKLRIGSCSCYLEQIQPEIKTEFVEEESRLKQEPKKQERELKFSLSTSSYRLSVGLEISGFINPVAGLGVIEGHYFKETSWRYTSEICGFLTRTEELCLHEHGIRILYRPFRSATAKFGLKNFNYQKDICDCSCPVRLSVDVWGPWLSILGSKVLPELPFIGRRLKLFGEAGMILVMNPSVHFEKALLKRIIPEFIGGIAFTFSPVEVKFDYHQIGFNKWDELYFTEQRASIEVDIYMLGQAIFEWLR